MVRRWVVALVKVVCLMSNFLTVSICTVAVYPMLSFPDKLLCVEDEVASLLSNINVTKFSGPDGIMLKLTTHCSTPAITRLFNLSLTSGSVPHEWKCASVTPIPKVPGTSDYKQFRPISLLPILSKVLERHVLAYLLDWALSKSLISDNQWGFLSGRSTTGVLVTTTDKWHRCLERGSEVCAVFLDLKKALDRVPHHPLMSKLGALDLNPFILRWLENYLMHQSQFVVVDRESSIPFLLYCTCTSMVLLTWSQRTAIFLCLLTTIFSSVKLGIWLAILTCRKTLILCMTGLDSGLWTLISLSASP